MPPEVIAPRPLPAFLVLGVAALGAGLVAAAAFPGYLNTDSAYQLAQAINGGVNDWHPPFTVLLWRLLLILFPGATGYLLLQTVLIWGSCAGLALCCRRSLGNRALLLALVPLTPGICNFLGNVQVDTMVVAWLLAGTALGYAGRQTPLLWRRSVCRVLASLCLICGALTRLNAIFCIIPLLLHAHADLGRRRNLGLCLAILLAVPVLDRVGSDAAGAIHTGAGDSVETYNLLALSFREHEMLLPGTWTPEQSRRIVEDCYSPVQWDAAWQGRCRFIFDTLHAQGIWNTQRMTRAWLQALARHPFGFVSIQLASFRRAMVEPNSPMLFWPALSPSNDALPRAPDWMAAAWRHHVGSTVNVAVSKPWLMVLLSCAGVVLILRRPRPLHGTDGLGLALMMSGQIYLLGYLVYGVSAEYRYYSWSGFCAVLGLLLAILGGPNARHPTRERPGVRSAAAVACLAVSAVAGALVPVAWAFQLPHSMRTVSIHADGTGPVRVLAIHDASTPAWVALPFEGTINAPGWNRDAGNYTSTSGAQVLLDRLELPRQDIEVRLATGAGSGRAIIESDGRRFLADPSASGSGTLSLLLPPTTDAARFGRFFSLRWVGGLGLCILVLFGLGWRLTLGRPAGSHP